jgi:hypothetical protein
MCGVISQGLAFGHAILPPGLADLLNSLCSPDRSQATGQA